MVLANRYDWQLFLEVTGPGGNKVSWPKIATLLAGEDNATSATIETLESPRERAALTGFSLIRLPDQEKWSGDGAGLKAITGGDAVSVDPKYRDAYSTHIPAVILAVNNNLILHRPQRRLRHLMQKFSDPMLAGLLQSHSRTQTRR